MIRIHSLIGVAERRRCGARVEPAIERRGTATAYPEGLGTCGACAPSAAADVRQPLIPGGFAAERDLPVEAKREKAAPKSGLLLMCGLYAEGVLPLGSGGAGTARRGRSSAGSVVILYFATSPPSMGGCLGRQGSFASTRGARITGRGCIGKSQNSRPRLGGWQEPDRQSIPGHGSFLGGVAVCRLLRTSLEHHRVIRSPFFRRVRPGTESRVRSWHSSR